MDGLKRHHLPEALTDGVDLTQFPFVSSINPTLARGMLANMRMPLPVP